MPTKLIKQPCQSKTQMSWHPTRLLPPLDRTTKGPVIHQFKKHPGLSLQEGWAPLEDRNPNSKRVSNSAHIAEEM